MKELRISYLRLRRRASKLLEGSSGPPVDTVAIAERLGAEVRTLQLDDDLSGILYRQDGRRVIVVNARHSTARRRLTVAHEVGHLVLHRGEPVHVDEGFRVNLRDPRAATAEDIEEVEATTFAVNLLMPAEWLRADLSGEAFDISDEGAVEHLSLRYGVSTEAMVFRLTSLYR